MARWKAGIVQAPGASVLQIENPGKHGNIMGISYSHRSNGNIMGISYNGNVDVHQSYSSTSSPHQWGIMGIGIDRSICLVEGMYSCLSSFNHHG